VARIIDPAEVSRATRDEIREEVAALSRPLTLVGFLSAESGPSVVYANYTRKGCEDVGVTFDLRQVKRLEAEAAVRAANRDPDVHGIMVYYPVFGHGHDAYIRDLVSVDKDVEGLHSYWTRCLYENRRFIDEAQTKKAILPCTPLAILKLLDAAGATDHDRPRPFAGHRCCIFNRSEVVGWPLASMMANDGAEVYSFDINGPLLFSPGPHDGAHEIHEIEIDRAKALAQADIVISGVPSREFPSITPDELKDDAICINFASVRNFTPEVKEKASVFVPRVGPMTVTMTLRNTLRLYKNTHH
jgi:methylenetetrahydrofolate dehydrogenase (NADP+)/methenyltetrahydrofolate cyclohydrolase